MSQLLDFFITNAYAQSASSAPAAQGPGYSLFFMIIVFSLFMYFFMWRPQNKRAKEQQNLLESLTKGDEVVTAGGLLGRISKISGQYLSLTIANNVEILIQKTSVTSVMPKGTLKTIE